MKLTYLASLLALVLSGCATTNSQQEIEYSAKLFHGSQRCAASGLMDQETAAKGISQANKSVYNSETARVNAKLNEYRATNPTLTQSECNSVRLHILANVESRATQAPAPAYQQPTTTNCSTYFGQTRCTTF